jgi:hypothetical protein
VPKNKIINTYKEIIDSKEVSIKVVDSSKKSKRKNRSRTTAICPECNSVLKLNNLGIWECTGNELLYWHQEFAKYRIKEEQEKLEFLNTVSDTGQFIDLYNKWINSQELKGVTFDCGYSNRLYPSHSNSKEIIPDPVQVANIEKKLGRKLNLEELKNEQDLWVYGGQYLTKYRKGAKKVKIKYITFPDEAY